MGVPCSFGYSSLAVQSHSAVKIVAPQVPDKQTPEIIFKYKNYSLLRHLCTCGTVVWCVPLVSEGEGLRLLPCFVSAFREI